MNPTLIRNMTGYELRHYNLPSVFRHADGQQVNRSMGSIRNGITQEHTPYTVPDADLYEGATYETEAG
jgi:hypothetical protein